MIQTLFLIVDSILVILLVAFDIMESKENKHLRDLCGKLDEAVTLLIKQNQALWELSNVVPKERET